MDHKGRWSRRWGAVRCLVGAAALAVAAGPTAEAAQPIKIGFGMALTGGLAGNGKAAVISMEIWREDVNKKGGLLGRPVELVYYDDQTKPANVPGIYTKLLDVDKVDLIITPYGTNMMTPLMPLAVERGLVFMGLYGVAINEKFNYPYHFQIFPSGPDPKPDFSQGFFEIALKQTPKPQTIALVAADAEFGHTVVSGARQHAKNPKYGLKIVYDASYPPATVDFTPVTRAIKATNPDIVFLASYPPDSAGMVLAAHEVGLRPKMFGGGMVGTQYAALMTKLGPKLNGIVNFDTWSPEPTLNFPGINEFLKKYQARAEKAGVDALGHYLPPYAYANIDILGQAVEATKGLDHKKIGDHIRSHEFTTIVGKVKFAPNGEWAKSRMLMVQFQNVRSTELGQFMGPGKRVVLYPEEWRSGKVIYPYAEALK